MINITPQEKSKYVIHLVDILYQIKNPVILDEYIKVASFKLDVSQNIIKTQVINKQSEEFGILQVQNEPNIRTYNENPYDAMEENLCRLVFSAHDEVKINYVKSKLNEYEPKSKILTALKVQLNETNNVDEVAKKLFLEFYNEQEMQNQISDIIFFSHEFDALDTETYFKAVNEGLERIKKLKEETKKDELRKILKDNTISQQEKLQILQTISQN